mgnify:FL=1
MKRILTNSHLAGGDESADIAKKSPRLALDWNGILDVAPGEDVRRRLELAGLETMEGSAKVSRGQATRYDKRTASSSFLLAFS